MTKWNDIPFSTDNTPEDKAKEFDLQYEENKASGDVKAEQDPYRRPNPTGGK
jgi:hypothetical protein